MSPGPTGPSPQEEPGKQPRRRPERSGEGFARSHLSYYVARSSQVRGISIEQSDRLFLDNGIYFHENFFYNTVYA